jgi:hypothetical protein
VISDAFTAFAVSAARIGAGAFPFIVADSHNVLPEFFLIILEKPCLSNIHKGKLKGVIIWRIAI